MKQIVCTLLNMDYFIQHCVDIFYSGYVPFVSYMSQKPSGGLYICFHNGVSFWIEVTNSNKLPFTVYSFRLEVFSHPQGLEDIALCYSVEVLLINFSDVNLLFLCMVLVSCLTFSLWISKQSNTSFYHCFPVLHLSLIKCPHMHWFVSGLHIIFHWFLCTNTTLS